MALGQTLKALRQRQGLNQKSLSALSGVSQATISRVETGRVRQLRSSALKNLADALGVSVDFLMGDSEVFASIPTQQNQEGAPGVREDRFRQIADHLEAFALHDEGRFLYANQTLAEMLGYRKEELLGKTVVDLVTAPESRPLLQRMLQSGSNVPYEILLLRRDGTLFPVEISGRDVTDNVRLSIVRDMTEQRCYQAAGRVHQMGLQAESLEDIEQILRIIGDEMEDMGVHFSGVCLNLIEEESDTLTSYAVSYTSARRGRGPRTAAPLQLPIQAHTSTRTLVSHWRRNRVWEREPDTDFFNLMQQHPNLGSSFHPSLVIDVPFPQGTLSVGLLSDQFIRTHDLINLMQALVLPLSSTIRGLTRAEALMSQLERAYADLQADNPASKDPQSTNVLLGLAADSDALQIGQEYRNLPAASRDLVRSFINRIVVTQEN
jgi:PAS domain S-box-containing protein